MRIVVDYSRCQGHGQCATVAPDIFEVRNDLVHLLVAPGEDVPFEGQQAVDDAIAVCPEAALGWATAEG